MSPATGVSTAAADAATADCSTTGQSVVALRDSRGDDRRTGVTRTGRVAAYLLDRQRPPGTVRGSRPPSRAAPSVITAAVAPSPTSCRAPSSTDGVQIRAPRAARRRWRGPPHRPSRPRPARHRRRRSRPVRRDAGRATASSAYASAGSPGGRLPEQASTPSRAHGIRSPKARHSSAIHRRPGLVEDRRVAVGAVDDGDATPGLAGDRRQQCGQPGVEQVLGDELAGHPADEPEREHLVPERRAPPARRSRPCRRPAAGPRRPGGCRRPTSSSHLVGDVQRQVERDGTDQCVAHGNHSPPASPSGRRSPSSSTTRSARFPVSIAPTSYQPKVCGRGGRRHPGRVDQRDTGLDRVREGDVHRQRAAGDRLLAVVSVASAVLHVDVQVADLVPAVRHPGRHHRVGDQRDPARCRPRPARPGPPAGPGASRR